MEGVATNSGIGATWSDSEPDFESWDCDCLPPPPPEFRLPPPPRPPFLYSTPLRPPTGEGEDENDIGEECLDGPIGDVGTCAAVPLVDPEYRSSPALPSIAVIVVCSLLLLAMLLIASVLIWKHKRKVQNFLPCKASPQSRCDGVNAANGVIYEDLTNIRPRAIAPSHAHCPAPGANPGGGPAPIELIDVKSASVKFGSGGGYGGGHHHYHPSVFICPPPPPPRPQGPVEHIYHHNHSSSFHPAARGVQHQRGPIVGGGVDVQSHHNSQDLYNPVYEELSNGSERGDEGQDSDRDSDHCHGDLPQHGVQREVDPEDRRGRRGGTSRTRRSNNGESEDEFAEDELSAGEYEGAPGAVSASSSMHGNDLESSCSDPDCCAGRRVESDAFLRTTAPLPHGSRGPGPPQQGLATTGRRARRQPPGSRSSERRPRSLDRRRGWRASPRKEAELQAPPPRQPLLFPSSSSSTASSASSPYCPAPIPPAPQQQRLPHFAALREVDGGRNSGVAQRLALLASYLPPLPLVPPAPQPPNDVSPYETVSVVGVTNVGVPISRGGITPVSNRPVEFSTFRGGKGGGSSQDSFGSDSGFSNNTSGGKASVRGAQAGGGGPHNRHSGGSGGSGGSAGVVGVVATELTDPFYGPGASVLT